MSQWSALGINRLTLGTEWDSYPPKLTPALPTPPYGPGTPPFLRVNMSVSKMKVQSGRDAEGVLTLM